MAIPDFPTVLKEWQDSHPDGDYLPLLRAMFAAGLDHAAKVAVHNVTGSPSSPSEDEQWWAANRVATAIRAAKRAFVAEHGESPPHNGGNGPT